MPSLFDKLIRPDRKTKTTKKHNTKRNSAPVPVWFDHNDPNSFLPTRENYRNVYSPYNITPREQEILTENRNTNNISKNSEHSEKEKSRSPARPQPDKKSTKSKTKQKSNNPLAFFLCMSGNTETLDRDAKPYNKPAVNQRSNKKSNNKNKESKSNDQVRKREKTKNVDNKKRHSAPPSAFSCIMSLGSDDASSIQGRTRYRVDGTLEKPYVFPSGLTFDSSKRRSKGYHLRKSVPSLHSTDAVIHSPKETRSENLDDWDYQDNSSDGCQSDIQRRFYLRYDANKSNKETRHKREKRYSMPLEWSPDATRHVYLGISDESFENNQSFTETQNNDLNSKHEEKTDVKKAERYTEPQTDLGCVFMRYSNEHLEFCGLTDDDGSSRNSSIKTNQKTVDSEDTTVSKNRNVNLNTDESNCSKRSLLVNQSCENTSKNNSGDVTLNKSVQNTNLVSRLESEDYVQLTKSNEKKEDNEDLRGKLYKKKGKRSPSPRRVLENKLSYPKEEMEKNSSPKLFHFPPPPRHTPPREDMEHARHMIIKPKSNEKLNHKCLNSSTDNFTKAIQTTLPRDFEALSMEEKDESLKRGLKAPLYRHASEDASEKFPISQTSEEINFISTKSESFDEVFEEYHEPKNQHNNGIANSNDLSSKKTVYSENINFSEQSPFSRNLNRASCMPFNSRFIPPPPCMDTKPQTVQSNITSLQEKNTPKSISLKPKKSIEALINSYENNSNFDTNNSELKVATSTPKLDRKLSLNTISLKEEQAEISKPCLKKQASTPSEKSMNFEKCSDYELKLMPDLSKSSSNKTPPIPKKRKTRNIYSESSGNSSKEEDTSTPSNFETKQLKPNTEAKQEKLKIEAKQIQTKTETRQEQPRTETKFEHRNSPKAGHNNFEIKSKIDTHFNYRNHERIKNRLKFKKTRSEEIQDYVDHDHTYEEIAQVVFLDDNKSEQKKSTESEKQPRKENRYNKTNNQRENSRNKTSKLSSHLSKSTPCLYEDMSLFDELLPSVNEIKRLGGAPPKRFASTEVLPTYNRQPSNLKQSKENSGVFSSNNIRAYAKTNKASHNKTKRNKIYDLNEDDFEADDEMSVYEEIPTLSKSVSVGNLVPASSYKRYRYERRQSEYKNVFPLFDSSNFVQRSSSVLDKSRNRRSNTSDSGLGSGFLSSSPGNQLDLKSLDVFVSPSKRLRDLLQERSTRVKNRRQQWLQRDKYRSELSISAPNLQTIV